jgi:multiple sugar transport system permease protein
MLLPTVFFAYFIVWRPTVMGFYSSLFKMQGSQRVDFVGLQNYIEIITDTNFLKVLMNTFKYTGFSLLIGFLPPLVIAILLNEVRKGQYTFRLGMYIPVVLPGIAVYMLWSYMYGPGETGLLNTILGAFGVEPYIWLQDARYAIIWIVVTMTWSGMGGTILMYFAALQGINPDLYEAASIDGAKIRHKLRYIVLPELYPIALLLFVKQIIGVFQVMEQPLTMTNGGPNYATESLALLAYKYAFVYFKFDKGMATGAITFVILIFMTIFYTKLEKKLKQ